MLCLQTGTKIPTDPTFNLSEIKTMSIYYCEDCFKWLRLCADIVYTTTCNQFKALKLLNEGTTDLYVYSSCIKAVVYSFTTLQVLNQSLQF